MSEITAFEKAKAIYDNEFAAKTKNGADAFVDAVDTIWELEEKMSDAAIYFVNELKKSNEQVWNEFWEAFLQLRSKWQSTATMYLTQKGINYPIAEDILIQRTKDLNELIRNDTAQLIDKHFGFQANDSRHQAVSTFLDIYKEKHLVDDRLYPAK